MSVEATTAEHQGHVVHRDDEGSKTGMWLFLFTELLLFGGLFLIYGVYRSMHEPEFHHAAAELNRFMGVTNTIVLLTSSLTMVLSVSALQRGRIGRSVAWLWVTLGCATTFLVIKFFEWRAKYDHHIWPGSDHLHELPHGEGLFFNLYFMMTGLHGIHVLLGLAVMVVIMGLSIMVLFSIAFPLMPTALSSFLVYLVTIVGAAMGTACAPLSLVGNVTTPTMLITGENDFRTPIPESEQYYQALKLRKVPTALVRVPGASHGIARRPSQLMAKVAHVLRWFEMYRTTEEIE